MGRKACSAQNRGEAQDDFLYSGMNSADLKQKERNALWPLPRGRILRLDYRGGETLAPVVPREKWRKFAPKKNGGKETLLC